MQCLAVSIIDDLLFEGNETFTIELTTLDENVELGDNITTVTIISEDGKTMTLICVETVLVRGH